MIGFATNWVAIKMLFWPRSPRPVFGQGLIPSQRQQLIEKVASQVLENLINEELILRKIDETGVIRRLTSSTIEKLRQITHDEEFKEDLRQMILAYTAELTSNPEFRKGLADRAERGIEEFAGDGFRRWVVGRLRGAWRGPLVEALNQQIEELDRTLDGGLGHLDGILERLPTALEKRQDEIERVLTRMLIGVVREVDVREIVMEQLDQVTVEQLEQGFKEFSDDKMAFITLLGGCLGVVGGTLIVWPLPSIAALAGLGLVLLLLDVIVARLLRAKPTAG